MAFPSFTINLCPYCWGNTGKTPARHVRRCRKQRQLQRLIGHVEEIEQPDLMLTTQANFKSWYKAMHP